MVDDQPTSGKEWRKPREQGILVTLPSGYKARICPISFETLLMLDQIPEPIAKAIAEVMLGKKDDLEMESLEDARNGVRFGQVVCRTCFVLPRIVDEPTEDDEIAIEDLVAEDINFVVRLLYEPSARLAMFHQGQSPEMEAPDVGRLDTTTGHEQGGKRHPRRKAVGE